MAFHEYDFVIIGGGVAGLVAASGAARLGARAALVEKTSLGGDCLRTGCVPTKRLVRSAKIAGLVKRAGDFGVNIDSLKVDFPKVMELVRKTQEIIGEHDDPARFRNMGADVLFGSGSFSDPHTFEVNGEKLRARKFLVSTGSSPVVPPIPGLRDAGALTNESTLELKALPRSIVILGGGPIGIEFAQVFSRLGSEVTVLERQGQILPKEDSEIADALKDILVKEGIRIDFHTEIKRLETEGREKAIYAASLEGERVYRAEEVMAATGRSPNVEGLGLSDAGVEHDKRHGIRVDGHLRSSQSHIYAAGDVAGPYLFTHVAEYQAGIALANMILPIAPRKTDYRAVPWATFTDPELARVGLTEKEARERYGEKISVYRFPFKDVDRAVIDSEADGLIKVVCDRKKRILGAHILGPNAGELIHEYVLAMQNGIPITGLSRTIHIYPALSMGVKRAADEYYREKLFSGWLPKAAKRLIRRGR